jgi:hypothetical protein
MVRHLQFEKGLNMKVALSLLFMVFTTSSYGHGISEADQQAMMDGGNWHYLWLGAMHMVSGYDHLLFLFGVVFYLSHLKDIFKFVTAFTVGHSITLIAATFLGITANYYLVDAIIALTVCYKAFDNLEGFNRWLGINPPHLLLMVLIFGLIHGFGLSTRLQELPLPEHGLIWRILSFNLGVELGQVAALAFLVLVLAGWRKAPSFKQWGTVTNGALFLAGVGLFFFQLVGFFAGRIHHDHQHEQHHDAQHQESHIHPAPGQPYRFSSNPNSDSLSDKPLIAPVDTQNHEPASPATHSHGSHSHGADDAHHHDHGKQKAHSH